MPEGLIFDVQRFSVHDGPGIRTTIFFKGCPLRCGWCQNPESQATRAEVAFYAERCAACGRCAASCPLKAIGRSGAELDRSRCDGCGRCADVCDQQALRRVGRTIEAGALVEQALRDRPFYQASGGGVTLSGGEPTMQPEFLGAVAAGLRDAGVSVGLQTCGQFRWNTMEAHLASIDFVHFDLKLMDSTQHRAHAGVGNETILDNAEKLVQRGIDMLFRVPIVPGFTDGANLEHVARFLSRLRVGRIQLLRYHAMGEVKRKRIGLSTPSGLEAIDAEAAQRALAAAVEALRATNLQVIEC